MLISIPTIFIIIANPAYDVTQLSNASHPLSLQYRACAHKPRWQWRTRSEGLDFDLCNDWWSPLGRGTKSAARYPWRVYFAFRVTAKYKRGLNFELVYIPHPVGDQRTHFLDFKTLSSWIEPNNSKFQHET